MKRRIRLGIVGAGRVGQIAHLEQYAKLPSVELALADMRPALLDEVADRFNIQRRFGDHHALLAAGVDAVVIVVRRPATGPVVLDAIARGVHVLSEKPMALTFSGAQTLVARARDAGVRYGVAYMKRFDAGAHVFRARVRQRVADRALGELVRVRAWSRGGHDGSHHTDYAMTPEIRPEGLTLWPTTPDWVSCELAPLYEELLNVHSHVSNLVRWIAGPFECASVVRFADRRISIVARTSDMLPVTFELRDGAHSGAWDEGIEVFFDAGSLRLDLPAPFAVDLAGQVTESTPRGSVPVPVHGRKGAFERQAQAFASWVSGASDFASPGADALLDIEFADRVARHLCAAPAALGST